MQEIIEKLENVKDQAPLKSTNYINITKKLEKKLKNAEERLMFVNGSNLVHPGIL